MTRHSGSPDRLLALLASIGALASTPVIIYDIAFDGTPDSPLLIALAAPLFGISVVLVARWRSAPLSTILQLSALFPLCFIPIVVLSTMIEPPHAASAFPWPWYLQPAAVAFAAVRWRPTAAIIFLVLSGATPVVVGAALAPDEMDGLIGVALRRVGLVIIIAIVYAVRRQLREYAEELSRNDLLEVEVARQRTERVANDAYRATIHDHVLGALLSVVHAEGKATEAVQREARSTLQLQRQKNAGTLSTSLWTSVLVERITIVTAGYECTVSPVRVAEGNLPSDVALALEDAVIEAVRNVVRHNPSTVRIAVQIEAGNESVSVAVADDGVGFDVDSAHQRLGVRESILGRMAAVDGGSASVESSVGRGTVVRVGWALR